MGKSKDVKKEKKKPKSTAPKQSKSKKSNGRTYHERVYAEEQDNRLIVSTWAETQDTQFRKVR